VLVRGSKNLSAPRIPHASSASRSYPLLQRPSGTRPARPGPPGTTEPSPLRLPDALGRQASD